MSSRQVLIVDGPLRGQVREYACPYFDHIQVEYPDLRVSLMPSANLDDALFKQIRYRVKRLVVFDRVLYVATSRDEFDNRDAIDLILSPAAKMATREC